MGLLLAGCLTSRQHVCISQGWICSDNCTCCHIGTEATDQACYLIQSKYTDTRPTSASADPRTPGRVANGVPIFKSLVWFDLKWNFDSVLLPSTTKKHFPYQLLPQRAMLIGQPSSFTNQQQHQSQQQQQPTNQPNKQGGFWLYCLRNIIRHVVPCFLALGICQLSEHAVR